MSSIDRTLLFSTLGVFGLDNKTTYIIEATLTKTYSKVKFLGELAPLFFNCALENVIREWNFRFQKFSGIKLRTKGLKVNCLAFRDQISTPLSCPGTAENA